MSEQVHLVPGRQQSMLGLAESMEGDMFCRKTMAIAVATLTAALLAAVGAFATPTTGSCSPTKVKFIASDPTFFEVNSTTFVNVPQGVVNFTQGGAAPSCVIVSVSAQPSASGGGVLTVRVVLDGVAGLPNEADFSDGNDSANQVHSFDFIFPSVAPGAHSVRVQFKTSDPAQFTDINRHNVVVQYAP